MNFSISDIWNNSLILRYPQDKIVKIGNLLFYENNNIYNCQHFFDFEITISDFEKVYDLLNGGYKVRFNYVDESFVDKIKELKNSVDCKIEYIDTWDAPILRLSEVPKNYFLKSEHSQIKKNYLYYEKNKGNFKFYNSLNTDVLKLWNYVLEIDFNSWKRKENSDMKSMNREDLQYLPFLLMNKANSSLVVICDLNDEPLAYSLMFRGAFDYWYAVKWGASNLGREKYAGFCALFNHIEYLYDLNKNLNLDFWGRRNATYDKIKNDVVKRSHIFLCKGDK